MVLVERLQVTAAIYRAIPSCITFQCLQVDKKIQVMSYSSNEQDIHVYHEVNNLVQNLDLMPLNKMQVRGIL